MYIYIDIHTPIYIHVYLYICTLMYMNMYIYCIYKYTYVDLCTFFISSSVLFPLVWLQLGSSFGWVHHAPWLIRSGVRRSGNTAPYQEPTPAPKGAGRTVFYEPNPARPRRWSPFFPKILVLSAGWAVDR